MHIEFRHLRTIKAIHDTGSLARAADVLGITQSALSHQIKGIEDQAQVELFVRRTKPLRLSAAGGRMLAAAERILPQISALEAEFESLTEGRSGRLHVSLECHACYDWLLPVFDRFRQVWQDVDVDLRPSVAFEALDALYREEVDLVISSDPVARDGISFVPLFDYEPVLIAAQSHPLAQLPFVQPENLEGQAVMTYPVPRDRLDLFRLFLDPAGIEPGSIRQVELTQMMLLLVASGRGVAVLPDWVLRSGTHPRDLVSRRLTEAGLTRRIYAAIRAEDISQPFTAHFIRLARQEALRLQSG